MASRTVPGTLSRCLRFRQPLRKGPSRRSDLSTTATRSASQDYGSGAGDPKGEDPLAQGRNPSEHIEHPGPAAPDVGKGSGSNGLLPHIFALTYSR